MVISNEQLAARAAVGDKEALEALYAGNTGLIAKVCASLVTRKTPFEDLMQEAFVCLPRIAKAFKPEKGYRFTSYLTKTLWGILKRSKERTELPQEGVTLNAPLSHWDEGEAERVDFIEEEEAGFNLVEECLWNTELRKDLLAAMEAELSSTQRELLRLIYWGNIPLREAGDLLGIEGAKVYSQHANVLRKLRWGKARALLRPWWEEIKRPDIDYEAEYKKSVEAMALLHVELLEKGLIRSL